MPDLPAIDVVSPTSPAGQVLASASCSAFGVIYADPPWRYENGTPAPEWMQELNGYTIQGAAEKIRARQCPECKGLGGATRRLPPPHVGSQHIDCPHCKGTGQKPTT